MCHHQNDLKLRYDAARSALPCRSQIQRMAAAINFFLKFEDEYPAFGRPEWRIIVFGGSSPNSQVEAANAVSDSFLIFRSDMEQLRTTAKRNKRHGHKKCTLH